MAIGATTLKVPKGAIPYVLLQRLEVQGVGARVHYSGVGHVAYRLYEKSPALQGLYRYCSTRLEPRIRGKAISSAYSETMAKEFASIAPRLPSRLETVLGVGPGVAGLEAHLSAYLAANGRSRPQVILLDKTELNKVFYGYHETAAAYNSLDVARDLLVANGQPADKITLIDANRPEQIRLPPLDLATSLIAWGFHFPVSTYLDLVYGALREKGVLIIDVRKDTEGRKLLEGRFGNVELVLDDPKFERLLATK